MAIQAPYVIINRYHTIFNLYSQLVVDKRAIYAGFASVPENDAINPSYLLLAPLMVIIYPWARRQPNIKREIEPEGIAGNPGRALSPSVASQSAL